MNNRGADVRKALQRLPRCTCVMTAAYDNKRSGQLVHWVQPCAEELALVCVAARKGHSVEPLIRDSHAFAICMIDPDDRLLLRKFAEDHPPDELGDPFDSIEVERLATGSPVLCRSACVLDCEVVRHFDFEADHEIYIGLVLAARAADSCA